MSSCQHRILLVEDDEADIELTVTAFKKYNLCNDIDIARDGVEALDYLHRRGEYENRSEHDPVVVLLDLKMPRMGGIEVLEKIKTDSKLKRIPVVVMTSSKEHPDIEKCYDLGVNAYVVKPVNFNEFTDSIKKLGLFWLVLNQAPVQRAPG